MLDICVLSFCASSKNPRKEIVTVFDSTYICFEKRNSDSMSRQREHRLFYQKEFKKWIPKMLFFTLLLDPHVDRNMLRLFCASSETCVGTEGRYVSDKLLNVQTMYVHTLKIFFENSASIYSTYFKYAHWISSWRNDKSTARNDFLKPQSQI